MDFKFVRDLMNMAFKVFKEKKNLLRKTPTHCGDLKVFKEGDGAQQLYLSCDNSNYWEKLPPCLISCVSRTWPKLWTTRTLES